MHGSGEMCSERAVVEGITVCMLCLFCTTFFETVLGMLTHGLRSLRRLVGMEVSTHQTTHALTLSLGPSSIWSTYSLDPIYPLHSSCASSRPRLLGRCCLRRNGEMRHLRMPSRMEVATVEAPSDISIQVISDLSEYVKRAKVALMISKEYLKTFNVR